MSDAGDPPLVTMTTPMLDLLHQDSLIPAAYGGEVVLIADGGKLAGPNLTPEQASALAVVIIECAIIAAMQGGES